MEEKIIFNYSKVKGLIKEKFGTQERFAKAVNMSRTAISQRLNNIIDFSDKEIIKWCIALEIEFKNIPIYFFTVEVQKHEQNKSA